MIFQVFETVLLCFLCSIEFIQKLLYDTTTVHSLGMAVEVTYLTLLGIAMYVSVHITLRLFLKKSKVI